MAEYIVVDSGLVSKVPSLPTASGSSVDSAGGDAGSVWEGAGAAGTMGVAGQTAWTMVRKAMGLENGSTVLAALASGKGEKVLEGKRILVIGASGGVGTILLQICRGLGAEAVVGICSGASEELAKRLGAHEVSQSPGQTPGYFPSMRVTRATNGNETRLSITANTRPLSAISHPPSPTPNSTPSSTASAPRPYITTPLSTSSPTASSSPSSPAYLRASCPMSATRSCPCSSAASRAASNSSY